MCTNLLKLFAYEFFHLDAKRREWGEPHRFYEYWNVLMKCEKYTKKKNNLNFLRFTCYLQREIMPVTALVKKKNHKDQLYNQKKKIKIYNLETRQSKTVNLYVGIS